MFQMSKKLEPDDQQDRLEMERQYRQLLDGGYVSIVIGVVFSQCY